MDVERVLVVLESSDDGSLVWLTIVLRKGGTEFLEMRRNDGGSWFVECNTDLSDWHALCVRPELPDLA